MRMMAVVLSVVMMLVPAMLRAQSKNTGQPSQNQAGQSSQAQTSEGDIALPETREKLGGAEPSQRISREVLHELLMLPYYSVFDNLAYKVNGNTVTLLGAVTNPTLKSDAQNVVKRIEGVENVDNNIKVLPPSPMDDRIRRATYRAIYGFDGLSKYSWGAVPSIHIIVDHGHVTLVGVVDNEGDKNMAGIQAKSVPGVFSVTNNLAVGGKEPKQQSKK
jgi:hyperosmotically inducible protein